ncbi:MAG: arginine--tRNA ligase [Rhizobiaceae bacterium]
MNIFQDYSGRIEKLLNALALKTAEGATPDYSRITVEPPRDSAHGDLACNAAMVLAKAVGMNPRALADQIAAALRNEADVEKVEVAGPGFINIRLSNSYWQEHLAGILAEGGKYGRSKLGAGHKINVEYVSANPTGPMHVGHCRGAVFGDGLANLLSFAGYDVTKEYYINDAGVQIDVLARSVMLRYREALGEVIGEIPAGLYPGDYLVPLAKTLADEYGDKLKEMNETEALAICRDRAIDAMMAMIREDLHALNVHHDVFFSEKSVHAGNGGKILAVINDLTLKGHVYRGKLPPPKGEVSDDWEDREQTLFRSTDVGDDIDRPLVKSDGSFTYFAADLAYFKDKFDRGFEETIMVLGADHGGYVKRMEALAKAVSSGTVKNTIYLVQLVKLFRNGEPVRMSKRAGEFVTLRDVVDEVGRDPVRFMMLYRKNDAPLDFDFAKVTEQSKENPVFYVQYGTARCNSIFREAQEVFQMQKPDRVSLTANLHLLTDEGEIAIVRKLAEFPRLIESAALAREPHKVAFYVYELASTLHAQWNKGKYDPSLRFVKVNERQLTEARLGLVEAVYDVLASGLGILGADAPAEMR